MAKIVIEFDGFEEAKEARIAIDAQKWKTTVWELDQELRKVTKYGVSLSDLNNVGTEIEIAMAERLREILREILTDNDLVME